jgi:hypothetical protein
LFRAEESNRREGREILAASTPDLEEEAMKKKATVKLALNRETLRDLVSSRTSAPNDSCVQSCFINSCGNPCEPPLPSLKAVDVLGAQ